MITEGEMQKKSHDGVTDKYYDSDYSSMPWDREYTYYKQLLSILFWETLMAWGGYNLALLCGAKTTTNQNLRGLAEQENLRAHRW